MAEYIDKDSVLNIVKGNWMFMTSADDAIQTSIEMIRRLPAADVPSALWTDEPISGTEFMTHNQGQRGFEIHFRTDDKAKYEAVQDECRRQIGHAKPAADVRPVVRGRWKDAMQSCHDSPHVKCSVCGEYYWRYFKKFSFCPNCGADMRGEKDV